MEKKFQNQKIIVELVSTSDNHHINFVSLLGCPVIKFNTNKQSPLTERFHHFIS